MLKHSVWYRDLPWHRRRQSENSVAIFSAECGLEQHAGAPGTTAVPGQLMIRQQGRRMASSYVGGLAVLLIHQRGSGDDWHLAGRGRQQFPHSTGSRPVCMFGRSDANAILEIY